MNREILFRGKRIDNGEWVKGYIYEHEAPLVCFSGDQKEDSKWYIVKTAFADWNMPRSVEMIQIDPNTAGQYMGLDDKNGVKIFEGDILLINHREWSVEEREIVEVKWCGNEGYPAFDIPKSSTSGERNGLSLINNCEDYSVEIIGNIYDNHELLEAQP